LKLANRQNLGRKKRGTEHRGEEGDLIIDVAQVAESHQSEGVNGTQNRGMFST